jgi:hypothetical protein
MITLARPYDTPTNTVTLPNPRLGDSEQVNLKVDLRHSMNGTMYSTYRKPVTKKLLLDFPTLTSAQKVALLAFLTSYAGEDIKYTDWRTVPSTYRVKILNAPIVFKELSAGSCGSYSFTLEMTTVGV